METIRRYNYRAYPTRGQREALSRLFGACRYAWNWYVRQRLTDWNFNRSRPSYAELSAKFNRTKTEKALEWLTQVSAVPLAQSLRQCEKAYSAFFWYVEKHGCHLDHKGRPLGYPRFKSRHCGEQSATFTTSARFHVRHDHNARWMFLDLPKIDGEIRLRWSRDLPSRPSSVTVMRHADGTYEASFVVKAEPKAPPRPRHDACGIDMGLEFDYANQCLDHMDPTGMELGRAVSERARSGRWSMGLLSEPNGVGWCHLPDKESLGADLYIEDDPAMLDRLMDLGFPVLVRRHAYNTAQCERAEQSGLGLAFDDWADVPGLAERLIGGSH